MSPVGGSVMDYQWPLHPPSGAGLGPGPGNGENEV